MNTYASIVGKRAHAAGRGHSDAPGIDAAGSVNCALCLRVIVMLSVRATA